MLNIQPSLGWHRSRAPQVKPGLPQPRFQGRDAVGSPESMILHHLKPLNPADPRTWQPYWDALQKAQPYAETIYPLGTRVSVIALGESGKAYVGVNLEVKGASASDTVHAEAFALELARRHGERRIVGMVQSLQPCGHCRQILAELGHPDLPIHILKKNPQNELKLLSASLAQLLPHPYTYGTPEANILKPKALPQIQNPFHANTLKAKAVEAAGQSYLPKPNERVWAGVAARLKNGSIRQGSVGVISGKNPTITPIQSLMVDMKAHNLPLSTITHAVHVEPENPDISEFPKTQAVLAQLAPGARVSKMQV